jgi:protein-S-isoprenylcysteine O-methyltransferase Ste14
MAWSFWEFQKAKANILPHKAATTLITTGPFARFRNPIYLADTLILLGLAEISRNIWFAVGALLFVILVTLLAIIPEERHLARKFGAEYEAYKARSRRWI